jgi:hypothetical protein
MERPVVDPHMVYSAFIHLPSPYEFSIPTTMVANTLVFHFEQLYRHRALKSGGCGDPVIVENPNDCFLNFCFHDLSHMQSFLMAEFNVSATHVAAMSKELSAAQQRISAAAAKGGFDAADEVASRELSSAAQERIAIAGMRAGALTAETVLHNHSIAIFHLSSSFKLLTASNHWAFFSFESHHFFLLSVSFLFSMFVCKRSLYRRLFFSPIVTSTSIHSELNAL